MSSAAIGWALAVAALAAGFLGYGWRGLVLALSVIVFWLLLQFSRTMRLMRQAAGAPVGSVASAVMFNAKLHTGMRLADAIRLTGSLGKRLKDEPQTYAWTDSGNVQVEVEFMAGRCAKWRLMRPGGSESQD